MSASVRDMVLSASLNWWLILDGWLAEDRFRVLESMEDWDSEDILCVLGLCGIWLSGEDRSQ